jgi:NAD(P)-dependent dehydrogenase (short-subunit alcohol dehydrogenase family)
MTDDRKSEKGNTAPVWLITGCSTGLGRALATRVLERGHRAVITARDPATLADLAARFPDTALHAALDVRNEGQRNAVVARALDRFGAIDVLVNNAGHGYSAAIEEGEDAPIRAMFETNFFALAALTRAVLPHMRARGRGHIVNISSIGGIVGNPASGYYSATKFAVEGLSEALAKEVEPLGIRVTLIEPGPFRTDFQGRSMTAAGRSIDAYAATAGARREQLRASSGRQAGDPVRAADAILHVVESATPPLHLILGKVGVQRVRDKLKSLSRSIDEWEQVSLAADFPEAGA